MSWRLAHGWDHVNYIVKGWPVWTVFTTDVMRTAHRWLRQASIDDDDEVCVFLTYAPRGVVADHCLYHGRAWANEGFKVVWVVALDDLNQFEEPAEFHAAAGVLLRLNEGYDFGAWAAAIRELPDLHKASRLALVNDSIYGPFKGFGAMLRRVRASDADVVGLTDSREQRYHFQSYLTMYSRKAIRSESFRRFWTGVRNGWREFVVRNYETRLVSRIADGALTQLALFPERRPGTPNRTLFAWRELIEEGFPFLKVRVVREDPSGASWMPIVTAEGYDPRLIQNHLRGHDKAINSPGGSIP